MADTESASFARSAIIDINPEVLAQLEADVDRVAVEFLHRPPYAILASLAAQRRDMFALIDRHPRPSVLPTLYRLAGQLSVLLAHASHDLGHPSTADAHARVSWMCADLAEDAALRCYTRWVQSQLAYWQGRFREAAELASDGLQFAASTSDALRMASQEARARSAMTDARETGRALALAAEHRSQASSQPHPVGVFYFAPGKAAYYASEVRLALGGPANIRLAIDEAQEAVSLFASAPEQERSPELTAAAQLDLVASYLALADLDAASEAARPVLQLPVESRTTPILQRVSKISSVLDRADFQGAALASDLREQTSLFCAYPAKRELP
ncbi:hypothetical protein [Streptacidiphilus sp. MAP5-52]|uniref:hypothetical protein n=1 Tax=Streptacidiphilus sp. MAP5-52 TaxID=3156267 RepID=UPI0035160AEF